MASAQVLPNSMASNRKLEHLEAGKRRLEEFRKKKAAERLKKPNQHHIPDGGSRENLSLESEHAQRITDSDGATSTNGAGRSATESSHVVVNDDRPTDGFYQNIEQVSLNERNASYPFSRNGDGANSANPVKTQSNDQETKTLNGLSFPGSTDVNSRHDLLEINNESGLSSGSRARIPFGTASDPFVGVSPPASIETDSILSQSSFHGVEGVHYSRDIGHSEKSTVTSFSPLHKFSANVSLQNTEPSNNSVLAGRHAFSSSNDGIFNSTIGIGLNSHEVGGNVHDTSETIGNQTYDFGSSKLTDVAGFNRILAEDGQSSESASVNTDFRSSSNYETPYTASSENKFRRSRLSFLDSLTGPRAPSGSFLGHTEPDKESGVSDGIKVDKNDASGSFFQNSVIADGFKTDKWDGSGSLSFQKPFMDMESMGTSSDSAFQSSSAPPERKHELYSSKQNEDFTALEQHIEDLTREKFSIQRDLEASRALAESLATENSSLTDSYNQQRSVVNQLKSDMEMLQEGMKTQMVELESIKLEYANALLECNAADERAKLIASEVIGLEEKALRLRSNELKLERLLENLEAEISSYKKKMSSMERERQDFQSTIDALQEEKKLLQSKLRKASTTGKSIDIEKISNRKDMSTSTEDLVNTDATPGSSDREVQDIASLQEDDPAGAPMMLENVTVEIPSVNIPPDHMRMIHNINALITELAVEKEELTQALTSELASSSRLKELNKELSRKLEAQTQRLELLTAQSMAGSIVPTRQPDSRTVHEDIVLADEGDEVVERVLGWIMKLFPGGPSRRRTSKLL